MTVGFTEGMTMEVGQLAAQAVRDLTTRLSGASASETGSFALPDTDPLFATFAQLAAVDGWGKLAYQRVRKNPGDARAVADLRRSLEQVVLEMTGPSAEPDWPRSCSWPSAGGSRRSPSPT